MSANRSITPSRFDEIERVCQAALDRPEHEREAFLDEACGADVALRAEVTSLLASRAGASGVLDTRADLLSPAPLRPDDRLGPYEIVAQLGAGGMGAVYRARDTRLGRTVAIKVIGGLGALDPAARDRFQREARAISSLNHPHICTLFDVGHAGGVDFLVMEHVEGQTLADRLRKGGLPLDRALAIASDIAGALAAAHRQGVIHRDLKPGNVMVTLDGSVKVLDFGLAKLVAPSPDMAAGETSPLLGEPRPGTLSRTGIVVGTPAYMSPEQATGGTVDARSDIFSFGVLLYELVTGRRAFAASSRADTIKAVISQHVAPPRDLVPSLPADVEKLILRCLKKDPGRRFQHMDDVLVELRESKDGLEPGAQPFPGRSATLSARSARRRGTIARITGGIGLAAVAAALYTGAWSRWTSAPAGAAVTVQLTAYPGVENFPVFSPDGKHVAFSWRGESRDNTDIYIKAVDGTTGPPLRLTTHPAVDSRPSWSPDGRSIAFLRTVVPPDSPPYLNVLTMPALGGPERRIASVARTDRASLSWTPDGRWLTAPDADPSGNYGIYLLPVVASERQRLVSNPSYADAWPAVSPDGQWLAFGRCAGPWTCDVHVVALGIGYRPNGAARRLTDSALATAGIAWTADSREVVYSASRAGANVFRLWRLALSPGSIPIRVESARSGAVLPSIPRNGGRLVYSESTVDVDIWRIDGGAPPRPLLSSTRIDRSPDLSPEGTRLVLCSNRASESLNLFVTDAEGTGAVQVTDGLGREQCSPRWSPDGKRIVFDSQTERGDWDLFLVDAAGGAPRLLTSSPGTDGFGSWSRDGKYIYFNSDRGGTQEVWRIPSNGGEAVQITDAGGVVVQEAYDGRTLYYVKTRSSLQPLFARTLGSPDERKVVDGVISRVFAVDEGGVFYFAAGPTDTTSSLRHYDAATGTNHEVAHLDVLPELGLTASRDGKTIVFAASKPANNDLWLIENFR